MMMIGKAKEGLFHAHTPTHTMLIILLHHALNGSFGMCLSMICYCFLGNQRYTIIIYCADSVRVCIYIYIYIYTPFSPKFMGPSAPDIYEEKTMTSEIYILSEILVLAANPITITLLKFSNI